MTEAQVVRFHQTGGPEVLSYETATLAPPGPGEVRLRQTAVGLNFIDCYHRNGLYPLPLPSGIGLEAAGVVEDLGPGVAGLAVGDRVAYCLTPIGAYASHRNYPADLLVKVPAGVEDEQAASLMLQGLTAWYLLFRTYPVTAGETVLFHAAAGGVGLIACQWAKHLGVRLIGTAGSRDKAELALAHGAAEVILYRTEDVAKRVRELTGGKGVPVVYDSVGKDTWEASLDSLAPRGLMVSFGNASGPVAPVSPGILGPKGSLYLTRPTLFHYIADKAERDRAAAEMFDLVARGVIRTNVRQRYALADAAEAHRALEARETAGSTVLLP
ncbi:quinone oxidoreductase family protein [Zavarzinia compransoris]|uniref:Quinone oxidoreductase n=1 Tax=Zavarzinia compransoris TaxID=1264899 RepID=A0A317E0S3_9PROT|nr:quinone oxidoreductase [Zavarzinia compransoris]PWR20648.1 quinone oxidoreductase [Zavarzinia compransoris]TDP44532.1 NADPH2:quinone reductase [Zavarzinia compransoris]